MFHFVLIFRESRVRRSPRTVARFSWPTCVHPVQNSVLACGIGKAQDRLRQIRELLQNRNLPHERMHELFAEAQTHEKRVQEFTKQTSLAAPALTDGVRVTGCTLAKMVLAPELRSEV